MIKIADMATKVFGILKGNGFQIKLYTDMGEETVDPELTRRFYIDKPPMMVTINEDEGALEVMLSENTPLADTEAMQQQFRNLANEYMINYSVRNYGKVITPRDGAVAAKTKEVQKECAMNVNESRLSKMFGSRKTSYQQLEDVKIHVKHKKDVSEEVRGARTRNIQSIFIENNGERLRFKHNHLGGARAMANHISYGGSMSDTIGEHIIESTGRFLKLKEFARYARSNRLVTEANSEVVSAVSENINRIKSDLTRLAKPNSYHAVAEKINAIAAEELSENEDEINKLKDMFTVKKFDETFADLLPLVNSMVNERNSYHSRIEEQANKQVQLAHAFESVGSGLEFNSDMARMGYHLANVARGIVENDELSSFVSTAASKMAKGVDISAFEESVVGSLLSNLVMMGKKIEDESGTVSIKESVEFENKMNSYAYSF